MASLTGGIFVANKLGLLAAIAVMGKPGFNHLKRLLVGVSRKIGPPQQVNRSRYLLGLILFLVPVLMTWIAPYAPRSSFGTAGVYGFLESRALEVLLLVGLFCSAASSGTSSVRCSSIARRSSSPPAR